MLTPSFDAVAGVLVGLAIPFGDVNRKDLEGEFFTEKTDFGLDLIAGERPVLLVHGIEDGGQVSVVGRVRNYEKTPAGIVVEVTLDKAARVFGALVERARAGLLGFSSGSIRHLVKRNPVTGEILRWPWVELSLTPTPANTDARIYAVKSSDALAHLAAVGIAAPALKSLLRTPIDSPEMAVMAARNDLALAEMRHDSSRAADAAYLDWLRIDNEIGIVIERST